MVKKENEDKVYAMKLIGRKRMAKCCMSDHFNSKLPMILKISDLDSSGKRNPREVQASLHSQACLVV